MTDLLPRMGLPFLRLSATAILLAMMTSACDVPVPTEPAPPEDPTPTTERDEVFFEGAAHAPPERVGRADPLPIRQAEPRSYRPAEPITPSTRDPDPDRPGLMEWTSRNRDTIEAVLLGVEEDWALLETASRQVARVPLDHLIPEHAARAREAADTN